MFNIDLDYNYLNEETKTYLKKAMEIYITIMDREIVVYSPDRVVFDKKDKKILALFMSCYYNNLPIKQLIDQYCDIKLDDLLHFAGVNTRNFYTMSDYSCRDLYKSSFKSILESIICKHNEWQSLSANKILPEVIMDCVVEEPKDGPKILDVIFQRYSNDYRVSANDHSLFYQIFLQAKDRTNEMKHRVPKKPSRIIDEYDSGMPMASSRSNIMSDLMGVLVMTSMLEMLGKSMKDDPEESSFLKLEKEDKVEKVKKAKITDESVWDKLDPLLKKYIAQEDLTEDLFYNIINNIRLAESDIVNSGERSIIFVDGPSGTGKTAISKDISKSLGVPCISTPITDYSSTGYVGSDLKDILKRLVKQANGDIEAAQRGIVILDEFDKLAEKKEGDLTMKKAVQDQLLDFLGGGTYEITIDSPKQSLFGGGTKVEFDTSKLTFILLGAVTNLRKQKTEKKQEIGFDREEASKVTKYSIKPEDLMEIGLQKELVGRINTFLHANDYSKDDLEKILRTSSISPMASFVKWVKLNHKEVSIDDDVYEKISEYAYDLNTGARSLQTIMNSIRTIFLKEVLRGSSQEIHLDSEVVERAYSKTVDREDRDSKGKGA